MNMETESAVLATHVFVFFCLFQVTPILELIAVRVDRSYQNCNNHASQDDRIVTYPLAQLDITALPRALVSRSFKFFFALDVSCPRDTQVENSLSRDAELAAAGSASKTDLLTSFLSRAVPVSCFLRLEHIAYLKELLSAPLQTLGLFVGNVSHVNLLCADWVLLNIRALGILRGIVGYVSVSFGAHIIRAVLPP